MVLPIELGPDPVVYGLSLAAITILFMKLGLNDWQLPEINPSYEVQEAKKVNKIPYRAFTAMMGFTFLLHGWILGGLIWMYQGTERNSKDNTILVLSCIGLGLNLIDWFFKAYIGMAYVDNNTIADEVIYGSDKIDLDGFKTAMAVIQSVGLVGFFTVSFAYLWVGDVATVAASNSRSLLTVSGSCLIVLFGLAMLVMNRRKIQRAEVTRNLLTAAGLKFEFTPTDVKSRVYHEPIRVAGLSTPLTYDNPNTPMLLAASKKASLCLKPDINAENWRVVKFGSDHYLTSPKVFDVHRQLMSSVWGDLAEKGTQHSGYDVREAAYKVGAGIMKTFGKGSVEIGFFTMNFPGYTIFDTNVAGLGVGLGVFFNTHNWMPLLSTLYMFGFYLLLLQHAVSALLALTITVLPSLIMCFFGKAQQWWELFRWNFIIGWNLINVCVYIITFGNPTSLYIRDPVSWNITNFPVQEFVYYTNADNSTTVLGYNAASTTFILAGLVGVGIIFAMEYCSYQRGEKPAVKYTSNDMSVGSTATEESTSLLNDKTGNRSSSITKRSVRYIS
jgi:hypothetical protein